MKARVGTLIVALALFFLSGIGHAQRIPQSLTLLTGVAGGTHYPIGAALAEIWARAGARANAEPGGSVSNIINVDAGRAEAGFTMSIIPKLAHEGAPPFQRTHTNFAGVAVIFPNFTHIMVRADSGVNTIADLKGRPFASQPLGTATQVAFADILRVFGLTEDDLQLSRASQAEGVQLVKDRHAVGLTATTAAPSGSFLELATSIPVKMLGLTDEEFQRLKEINDGFVREVLPPNTYPGQTEPVYSVGTDGILIVNKNMPEEEVYWMTKTLIENIDQVRKIHPTMADLTPEKMAAVAGVALHPGAKRFYDEYFSR